MNKTIINPSALGKQLAVPQIKVIEEGKEVVRPDVLGAVVQLATLGQLTKIRKSLEKGEFEGKEDPRTLNATDKIQVLSLVDDFPYTPWADAYIINKGPDAVRISTDRPYAQFTMEKDETVTIGRTHADERIRLIFYVCDPGETAKVRITGQY